MQTLCWSFQVSFTVLAHISKEHRTDYHNDNSAEGDTPNWTAYPSITKHCSISIRNSYECLFMKFKTYNCINQISVQLINISRHHAKKLFKNSQIYNRISFVTLRLSAASDSLFSDSPIVDIVDMKYSAYRLFRFVFFLLFFYGA